MLFKMARKANTQIAAYDTNFLTIIHWAKRDATNTEYPAWILIKCESLGN